ncbi:hypothetical protein CPB84DRAFT_533566 [Gymnopilus junonius]|uniref:Uncharacterized protein n=1 Tax=Gymnopilus junonius TaxID=109634 RepID=A0A9P5TPR8_GYMJU|nr:hypothetical protein CPB84DRAFT_533566 [Gymnopilus junonius]
MANSQLNGDIYSHLLSFVSSSSDLVAISQANKELLDLTEPELLYRSIRCKLEDNAVWEHLISSPAHASRVRELTIEGENGRFPPKFTPYDDESTNALSSFRNSDATTEPLTNLFKHTRETTEHSEHLLIQALTSMVNLESFTWDRGQVPLIHEGEEMSRLPTAADDRDAVPDTYIYREDIWTVLRDYTQLRRLKVVDQGRVGSAYTDSRPIFNSTMFTLRNLTHLDFQTTFDESPESGHVSDEDSDGEDLHATVEVLRLRDLLSRCPNIESLSLHLTSYATYNISSFTDITPILSTAHWPQVKSLKLKNIFMRSRTMADFLRAHSSLQTLSAILEFSDQAPFNLQGYEYEIQGILPRLEDVDLPASALRPLLRVMGRPSSLRRISYLEPCDWGASDCQFERDDSYVASLDDVWGSPTEEEPNGLPNLLRGLTNLTSLTTRRVATFSQLRRLIKSTPNLQYIHLDRGSLTLEKNPHSQLLSYLAHWPKLAAYEGEYFWPPEEELELNSERTLSIVRESITICPILGRFCGKMIVPLNSSCRKMEN